MPLYEGISFAAEKHSVIVDLGHAYTKCGFAREPSPRWIIPSTVPVPHTDQVNSIWSYWGPDDLFTTLKEFMSTLYFKYLAVSPKDRRVVVVESVLCPTLFRNTIARVLFEHFEVPAVAFVPSHLMALYTLGVNSALVLDCGYFESVCLPVYEGVCILSAWQALPLGGAAVHRRIAAELGEASARGTGGETTLLGDLCDQPLKESILEDVKVRTCFVTTVERGRQLQIWGLCRSQGEETGHDPPSPPPPDVEYPLDGDKILTVPGTLREYAAEVLFELDGDMKSVATLLLDSILKAPMDARKTLAQNIVVMGGTAMTPGFEHRLLAELHLLVNDPDYKRRMKISLFKFHKPPCKKNYTAWLGASIYGSTDALAGQCVTKEQFQQNGQHIPDWSDQMWHKTTKSKSSKSA